MEVLIVDYKLFDYEIEFLKKEITSFGGKVIGDIKRNSTVIVSGLSVQNAQQLTYIKGVYGNGKFYSSHQYIREHLNNGKRVQSKRYGPHSLHEFKGRYNPQMPRSLLLVNFFDKSKLILDPFMGSGTTVVEARGLHIKSIGLELNSFAYLIAKAKKFYEEVKFIPNVKLSRKKTSKVFSQDQESYLEKWFPKTQLNDLENILDSIENVPCSYKEKLILKIILSNLLRDHSLQDPRDLRIRRRSFVPSGSNLSDDFLKMLSEHQIRHSDWIKTMGINETQMIVKAGDSTHLSNEI